MPNSFSPSTWADGTGGGTPITAAQLNRLEAGIEAMDDRWVDDSWLDIRDFGAVGDYVVATGTGTDNTAAIQAAVNAAAAAFKKVWIPVGRYKTTAPINLVQNSVLRGPMDHLRTAAITNEGGTCSIEFAGGNAQSCIVADGSAAALSTVHVGGFSIIDRRNQASVTDGHGVYFNQAVNNVSVTNMDISGFKAGAKIRITSPNGTSSDNVHIEDIWCQGESPYSLQIDSVDNYCLIRQIMHDTLAGAVDVAMIRLSTGSTGAILIEGIKHENSSGTCSTVLLDFGYRYAVLEGICSRTGDGGPVLRITNNDGSQVLAMGLVRSNSGVLVQVEDTQTKTISGTRLPWWVGGSDGLRINQAMLYGLGSTGQQDRMFVKGQLLVSDGGAPTDVGKLTIVPDSASQSGLTMAAADSQTANYLRFMDSGSSTVFRVDSTGKVTANRGLFLNQTVETGRTAVADANYTVSATDFLVAITSLTAARTITLPPVSAGRHVWIQDESGSAATFNITIARNGSPNQLLNGQTSAVINQAYGRIRLYSNGTNWFY